MLTIDTTSATFSRTINVQFPQANGSVRRGSFQAVFRRVEQPRIEEMVNDNWTNSEVLDEVLESVSGIGRSATEELPPEEAMAWARKSTECVTALVQDFFMATRQDVPAEKTSKKRR